MDKQVFDSDNNERFNCHVCETGHFMLFSFLPAQPMHSLDDIVDYAYKFNADKGA